MCLSAFNGCIVTIEVIVDWNVNLKTVYTEFIATCEDIENAQ